MKYLSTFGLLAILTAVIAVGTSAPSQARETELNPKVINGIPSPPLSGAAVAIKIAGDFYCTGSLWRSRILATAAHCLEGADEKIVAPNQITLWSPGSDSTGPPSAVRVTDIIIDANWSNYAEDAEEAIARDLAFLILDQPLGTPTWTRMATQSEAAALTWNEARVEFVGYGNTSASVDPNARPATTPNGVDSRLRWGYDSGLGVFEIAGDRTTGTCGGDSGGPWMSRVGNEILYLGPLSGGQGLPCDKPRPPRQTYDWAPVAAANTDLINVALATAGESATRVPRTCIQGEDVSRKCRAGRAWDYDFCWSGKKAELWKWSGGNKWNRVDRFTGYRDEDFCGKKFPYRVIFRGIETKKSEFYEVYLPKQPGIQRATADQFRVTVSPG